MRALPRIDSKYWLALVAASVFGTNTGDYVAGRLHLGHLAGLPWLLAVFVLILAIERFAPRKSAFYFWAAIITMRTAATNVGDAFHDFGMGFWISVPVTLVLFALSVFLYKSVTGDRKAGDDTVGVNWAYWVAMMLAGVLGTVGGDAAAFGVKLTAPGAAVLFAILIYVSIRMFGRERLLQAVPYWTTVGLIRTGGTAGGDSVAHAIGLPASTVVTGIVFIALVFASVRSTQRAAQPA